MLDETQDYYDPDDLDDAPTSTLKARAQYFWGQMDADQRHLAQLVTEAALSVRAAHKLIGKKLPRCENRAKYIPIKRELLRRMPSVDPVDLLALYAELHDQAKGKGQINNARQCLDSMARISGADQPRIQAQIPENAGAPEIALALISQMASGQIPVKEGQQLLQALETGAKLEITQHALNAASPNPEHNPHAVGTEAHAFFERHKAIKDNILIALQPVLPDTKH